MAVIVVRRNDLFAHEDRFTGKVLVDRRQLGYLVGIEPRAFEVEPGEHTITVDFGRRLRIFSSSGRATCSASVSLAACERVDLACGIDRDVVRGWVRTRWADGLRVLGLTAIVTLAAWAGWFLSPILRDAVAMLALRPRVSGALISYCYRLLKPASFAFWFALAAALAARRSSFYPRNETDRELVSRIGPPYYLERMDDAGSKKGSSESEEL